MAPEITFEKPIPRGLARSSMALQSAKDCDTSAIWSGGAIDSVQSRVVRARGGAAALAIRLRDALSQPSR